MPTTTPEYSGSADVPDCFHALRIDSQHRFLTDHPITSRLVCWDWNPVWFRSDGTHFGYVWRGPAELSTPHGAFTLASDMWFALPDEGSIRGGAGIVTTRFGYRGLFQIGGPAETTGRLRYIEGCTDTLLIAPVMLGDPCLNLLHIPPGTRQTAHTHPSVRTGMIVSGRGRCVTPAGSHELSPGLAFLIDRDGLHSFHTDDEALRVIAYHPDSDFGPTHDQHPMVNRTIIPAAEPAGAKRP